MSEKPSVDLTNYLCGECGGNTWNLKIGHCDDGRTYLYVMCANKDCQSSLRTIHGVDDDVPLIWDELDITGQGHDPQDMVCSSSQDHLN